METDIRKIQYKCIEILDIVDNICKKYNISYSLCGGSVVGAHLYGKCLPWDDDIDLMMTRENYNSFLNVVKDELPEGYSVQNYQLSSDFASLFTKIINNKTTVVQKDGAISGVFLDITVYDKIPDNLWKKEDFFLWRISQIVMIGEMHRKGIKDFVRNFLLRCFIRDKRHFYAFFQKRVEKNANKSHSYHYSELFGAYCNTKPYERGIFENYSSIKFEGKSYMIVRDYVQYLITRYERTNFYEPKEKQIAPHYSFVDLDLPYKEYIKCCKK